VSKLNSSFDNYFVPGEMVRYITLRDYSFPGTREENVLGRSLSRSIKHMSSEKTHEFIDAVV